MKITAKDLRALAASVRGARSMNIETEKSKSAPAVLAQAEKILEKMIGRVNASEPSAPDMAEEIRYYSQAEKAQHFNNAIIELKNALNGN